jgi:hypothetical protein
MCFDFISRHSRQHFTLMCFFFYHALFDKCSFDHKKKKILRKILLTCWIFFMRDLIPILWSYNFLDQEKVFICQVRTKKNSEFFKDFSRQQKQSDDGLERFFQVNSLFKFKRDSILMKLPEKVSLYEF